VSDMRVQHADVRRFAYDAFKAVGCDEESADLTAYALWLTSVRGVDSHAIRLLPHYVAALEAGRLNPTPKIKVELTAMATGIIDADHALGHVATMRAMRYAIRMAESTGVGIMLVKNSSHNGSMATYGLEAANKDMIGMAVTNASTSVRTPNSTTPFFGTNPTCITAPMLNEAPFCFDATPVPFSVNKVRNYGDDGKTLPDNTAADKDGHPTNDPAKAFQMLPIGDYKGFGFLMMADVLSSQLTGMPSGDEVRSMYNTPLTEHRYLAHFCMAIRISAFREVEDFKRDLQTTADKIRQQPRMTEDVPVMVPGDPEKAITIEREANGVPITILDMEKLNTLASRLNVTPLREM